MGEPSRGLPPDRWSGNDGDDRDWEPARELPDHPAEPSWATVLATTSRLWLERRGLRRPVSADAVPKSAWRRFGLLGLVLVIFAAGALTVALVRQTAKDPAAGPPGGLSAASPVRDDAAAWIVRRVSPGAIVACDPAMCSVLQKRGFPAGSLLVLGPSAGDPLGSSIVVATAALRSQFGRRLTSEYAPVAIAGFGSGTAGVQVLVTAQDGAASYLSALRADLRARRLDGTQLLGNDRIGCSAVAGAALSAGRVDTRLLITLAAMAQQQRVQVLSFGGAAPGASGQLPLSTAELAIPPGLAARGYLRSALALLRAQRAPYLASSMTTTRLASGRTVLLVGFAAPGPLGLLGPSAPLHTQNSDHPKKSPGKKKPRPKKH